MKLTCAQMDVLISFYIENDLSPSLKKQVEEHLEECKICHAKYDIIDSMLDEIRDSAKNGLNSGWENSEQYRIFKTNLSAYMDNELPDGENIKIKKFTIQNKQARKELENSYNIRKLISDSFKKTKNEVKTDFTRSTLKRLQLEDDNALNFHPAIRFLIIFTISVLILSTIVLVSLNI